MPDPTTCCRKETSLCTSAMKKSNSSEKPSPSSPLSPSSGSCTRASKPAGMLGEAVLDSPSGTIEALKASYEELKARYEEAKKTADATKADSDLLLDTLIAACPHKREYIIEARRTPPYRVCMYCGYAEEGWGCGYSLLLPLVYSGVPRWGEWDAWNFVRKFYHNEAHFALHRKRP